MSKDKGQIPAEAGLYYASSGDYKWFNLLVDVRGEAPFLTCFAWNRGINEACGPIDADDVTRWGPRIPAAESL